MIPQCGDRCALRRARAFPASSAGLLPRQVPPPPVEEVVRAAAEARRGTVAHSVTDRSNNPRHAFDAGFASGASRQGAVGASIVSGRQVLDEVSLTQQGPSPTRVAADVL